MKLLLILLLSAITVGASAQKNTEQKTGSLPQDSVKLYEKDAWVMPRISLTPPRRYRTPRTYYLSLDNMPCVVPDTKEVKAMPNAARGNYFRRSIPNPATPSVQ